MRFTRIISILLVALTVSLPACNRSDPKDEKAALYTRIVSVDRLNLATMTINKLGQYNDESGWKIGKRIAVYSYNTYMDAFIDLTKLTPEDVELDEASHTAIITVPPVELQLSGRDVTMKEEHYRVSGLRSRIGSKERAQLKEEMNTQLKKEIKSNPAFTTSLRKEAQENAKVFFSSLLASKGYSAVVRFK